MNKQDLVSKLKQLEGLTPDERAYLTNLINTKKYGLVWEDKPEDAEELLRTHLPVLREVEERRITPPQPSPKGRESALNENTANLQGIKSETNATQTLLFDIQVDQIDSSTSKTKKNQNEQTGNLQNEQQMQEPTLPPLGGGLGRGVSSGEGRGAAPNHILIEGDNLHALTALTFTHEGKVDVMYFDPPYNTGNKDFKYNDTFVDKEDSFRHSKWLSFMDKRLKIAKRLLSDKGVVFISIDDNEQAQLKLLCDEVFGENNFLADIIWEKADSPRMDAKFFSSRHDHTLVYSKNINLFELGKIQTNGESTLEHYSKIDEMGRAYYLKPLRAMGKDGKREARPSMYYSVLTPDNTEFYPKNPDGSDSRWRWSKEKLENESHRTEWIKTKNGWSLYFRIYAEDNLTKPPETIWFNKDVGSNRTSKLELTSICPNSPFDTPKPIGLLKRIVQIGGYKNSIILDFFAGSGTTLHATMQLNAEDGGNRQCILVTNNENNICEEVTYERNKRVIQGYTNTKGVPVAGLANNNLRYYRTEFVGRERSLKNKRLLVQAATQMLCVKEDIYTEITEVVGEMIDKNNYRCFTDNDRYMLVIYNEEVIEELVPLIAKIESKHKIKIYVFAPGQYPYTEEFEDVLPKVELCALPDAIYKAYANVLPKKKVE